MNEMNKFNKPSRSMIWIIGILGVIFLGVVLSCGLLFGVLNNYNDVHAPERLYDENGSYRFNLETISEDILGGKEISYEEIEFKIGFELPVDYTNVMVLSEKEIMYIVRSFFNHHWQEDVDDWALQQITYRAFNCEEGMSGMVYAIYKFQKYHEDTGKLIIRSISIQSWDGTIDWREYAEIEYGAYHEIAINNYDYSATQALALVDQNSGREILQDPKETCEEIQIKTYSGNNPEWTVRYVFSATKSIYFDVNARTGKVNKR